MKEKIKKIPGVIVLIKLKNKLKENYLKKVEFKNDEKFFKKYYSYSKPTKTKIEYNMILEVHKLEKGMACVNPRPFGFNKVKELIKLIEQYEKITSETSYSYNLANTALLNYCNFYEEHKWQDTNEYTKIKAFLKTARNYNYVEVGAYDLYKKDFIQDAMIDYNKFLSSRRSIRNYSNRELDQNDIDKAVEMAIKSPSACNRQMCKIYYAKDIKSKKIVENFAQGIGLFDLTNINYFVVTFDISANYFIGERNQGWFNAGLFSMNFVNALHSLGIGSCFIQVGNSFYEEQSIKRKLGISESERIAVIITAGYYDEVSRIPCSTRKRVSDVYREI